MIYNPPPLVEVIWRDTAGWNGWDTEEKWREREPMIIRTLGYLIEKTRGSVKLAMDYRADDVPGCICCIPRGCVVQIRELEPFLKEGE